MTSGDTVMHLHSQSLAIGVLSDAIEFSYNSFDLSTNSVSSVHVNLYRNTDGWYIKCLHEYSNNLFRIPQRCSAARASLSEGISPRTFSFMSCRLLPGETRRFYFFSITDQVTCLAPRAFNHIAMYWCH